MPYLKKILIFMPIYHIFLDMVINYDIVAICLTVNQIK